MQDVLSVIVFDQDDPFTLKKVTQAITEYRSEVVPCSSPQAILDSIQKKTVDVIVLNLEKTLEKPFDLLSQIKARVAQVEVVCVSRFDDEKLWLEAIQCGAYDLLAKPLNLSELKRILVQATEKHHTVNVMKRPPAYRRKLEGLASGRVHTGENEAKIFQLRRLGVKS